MVLKLNTKPVQTRIFVEGWIFCSKFKIFEIFAIAGLLLQYVVGYMYEDGVERIFSCLCI